MRRGQGSASSAAILVALIGVLLVGYIVAIPPADRESLLNGNTGGGNGNYWHGGAPPTGGGGPVLIMAESPGTLELQPNEDQEHPLPSTTVFTQVNTIAVGRISSIYVKQSLFSKQPASMEFTADLRSGKNYLLTFNVEKAGGNLIIALNDHIILNQPITEKSPQPIRLPEEYLNDGKNRLSFWAGDVGMKFWTKNEYLLKNIQVVGDIIDVRGATSEQHFTITDGEYNNMESAELSFVPNCDPRNTGRLTITLNGKIIYSGYSDCGVMNRVDISKDLLRSGDNTLLFISDEGSYLLDRIRVKTRLVEQDYPVYYFNLPVEMFDSLETGDRQLLLTMRFSEYRKEKRGEVTINGFVQAFSTDQLVYQAAIDPGILLPGPNTIQIVPQTSRINLAELKIEMI